MNIFITATLESLLMVFSSTLIAVVLGLPLAILLVLWRPDGLNPKPSLFSVFDLIINMLRSFPFIILLILVMPISRLIIGRSTGTFGMILPLSISAAPFVARIFEQNMLEVSKGKIEAALAMGANNAQIVRKVLLSEAAPAMVNSVTITIVNIIGYSAMAGAIGGGGLGDLAVRFGLYNRQPDKLFGSVVIIIIFVQIVQILGKAIGQKIDHR